MSRYEELMRISNQLLFMHRLSHAERMVASVVLTFSFGMDRMGVIIPQLQHFSDLTGLDRADVSRAVVGMFEKGILDFRDCQFFFRPGALWWQSAQTRVDLKKADAAALELHRLNSAGAELEERG